MELQEGEVLHVREWELEYEVTSKGLPWSHGEVARLRPLDYVRVRTRGRYTSRTYRRMVEVFGEDAIGAVGLFTQLLSITAANERDMRGFLVTRKGPMGIEDIAKTLMLPPASVERYVQMLLHEDVEWLEILPNFPNFRNLPNFPKLPESYITERNETERNRTEPNLTKPNPNEYDAGARESAGSQGAGQRESKIEIESESAVSQASNGKHDRDPEALGTIAARALGNVQPNGSGKRQGTSEALEAGGEGPARPAGSTGKRSIASKIESLTGEPHWTPWWKRVAHKLFHHHRGGYQELVDLVRHVEDSQNPRTAEAKGIGEIHEPGRFLVGEVTAILRSAGLTWPRFPQKNNHERMTS